jgi:hypothetical protein
MKPPLSVIRLFSPSSEPLWSYESRTACPLRLAIHLISCSVLDSTYPNTPRASPAFATYNQRSSFDFLTSAETAVVPACTCFSPICTSVKRYACFKASSASSGWFLSSLSKFYSGIDFNSQAKKKHLVQHCGCKIYSSSTTMSIVHCEVPLCGFSSKFINHHVSIFLETENECLECSK